MLTSKGGIVIIMGQVSSRELEGQATASQPRSWSLRYSPGSLLGPCWSSQGGPNAGRCIFHAMISLMGSRRRAADLSICHCDRMRNGG